MTDDKTIYVTTDNSKSSQNIINAAIKTAFNNGKSIVHLNAGLFTINSPIEMYSGITLEGEGKDKTCIKLIDHAALDTKSLFYIEPAMRNPEHGANTIMVPLIWAAGSTGLKCIGANNIIIRDFEIDVNYDNNSEIRLGRGYFNCIQLYNSKNVRIYNMYMHDGHGDGVRIVNSDDVQVYDSKFIKLGHDAVFFIRSNNCHHYGNIVSIRTNSGGRCNDCTNSSIHDNMVYGWSKTDWSAGGPGFQIERQYWATISVDVYNNSIYETYGCGIWCARNVKAIAESGKSKVNIRNNIIYGCGINKIYYQGGIVIDGIHGVYFDNNVVDGCYGHGVVCMGGTDAVVSAIKVNVYVRNNIIVNTKLRLLSPTGTGFGIHNRYPTTHVITASNNCVYNNASGPYKNVSSKNDINKNPLFADKYYKLKPESPCIGAGLNKVNIGLLTTDDTVDDTVDDTANKPESETDSSSDNKDDTSSAPINPTPEPTKVVTAKTKIIYPQYNNRLKESVPASVLRTDTFIDIGLLSNKKYRGMIYFDLNEFKNLNIKKAILSMYWYYPANTKRVNNTIVEIYRSFPYTPAYASWKYRKQGITWDTIGGNWYDKNDKINGTTPFSTQTFTATTVPTNKYYDFDITDFVKNCANGSISNTGLFIKAKVENNNYIAFYSGNMAATNKKIKLTVEYE